MTDILGQAPDIVGEIQAQKAYGPIYSAQYGNALKSARANELGRRLGIPPDVVETDIPNMMARDRLNRAVETARQNQAYAQIMANPRVAAAGIDDPHLPTVASAVSDHTNYIDFAGLRQKFGPVGGTIAGIAGGAAVLGGRLASGVSDLFSSASNLAHAATQVSDYNNVPIGTSMAFGGLPLAMRLFGKEHDALTAVGDATRYQTSNRTFNDIASGVESLPTNAAALAATAVGGPAAGAAVFAGQAFGDSFEEGAKAGLNPNQSALYGVGDAAIMGGTMFLPEKYLGGAVAGKGGALKALGSGVGLMQAATALQGLNHWYFIDKPKGVTFDQFLSGLPDQEQSSFVSTVAALGLTAGAGHVVSRLAGHAVDTQAAQHLDNVMEASAKSSTRTANPSDFEAALNQLVGDSNGSDIYVPADKVKELFQPEEGKAQRDIRSDPFWGQYAGQVEEAATLGGDVVVPLAQAATHLAGSSDWNAIREFVRTRPGGASQAEVKASQTPEELEAMATEVAQKIDAAVPQLKAQALTKDFADQLGYKGEQAGAISQLLGAGLSRAHAIENAKRAGRGEEPVPMEDFAAAYLPQATRMTQAEYDAAKNGAQEPAGAPPASETAPEVQTTPSAPPARTQFDPHALLADAVDYIKKGGSVSAKALGKRYGLTDWQTEKLQGVLAGVRGLPLKMGKKGLQRAPMAKGPVDVVNFVRGLGGIRDDAGHDLSKGRGYSSRPGLINNRGGRSLDELGEALHEAGYFTDRPSEDDVQQMIERSLRGDKVYPLHEQADAEHAAASRQSDEQEQDVRFEIQSAAKELGLDLNAEDEDFALELVAHGYTEEQAAKGAHELRTYASSADALDKATAEGVKGDYAEAADELRSAIASRVREALGSNSEQYVPGFDSEVDRVLAARSAPAASDFDLFQTLNQLFEEPTQPNRTMTAEQRAELEARQQQSMARRGGQQSVKDQEGGLFSVERDQDTLLDTQRRGNISIARDEHGLMTNAVIRAFEHADFSTAIHETGHFFLEDLKRRALGPDATDQEKADWQAVKDWTGETGDKIADASHETFARGFERYIYEGNAPSAGLKAVFAKMRNFMVSLYRSIRAFNSPITPEIRNVMDRLLASDDEITARREELRLGDQALHDLMSAEEQTRYAALGDEAREEARDKLYDKVLSTIRAERTRAVSKRKGEIRQEIGDSVDQQPVFKALKLLRSGVPKEDGTTERATIPRQWLVDNYGEGIIDKLPKGVPPIVDDAHGVDPEGLAHSAGFDSADQMVQKLLAHEEERQGMKANGDTRPPRRALIEGMTDERLRNEMGDPYANLEEEADAALANEKQADRLSLELRALARKTGKTPVPWKLAKDWARAHIRDSSSKEAISGAAMQTYTRAATKAAQNVEDALVKKDYDAAFRAKQQQVLNLALMAQAKEAKDEVLAGVKRLRRIAKAKNIPSVDQDYLDVAHRLLENVDMKSRPEKAVDKRLAFEAWHARQVEMEIDPVVPPEYQSLLGQTHWSRLSINDLLDLDKAVKQIVKLGRLKRELKDGQKTRDYNEAVSEMQDRGGAVPPRKIRGGTTDPRKSPLGRAASRLRTIDAAMVKTEQVAIWLDNHDPNGPWQRMLYRPFADAQGRFSDLFRSYSKDINDLIKAYPKAAYKSLTRAVDTPELVVRSANHLSNGEAFHGTKDQVLMMAMNWGNLGNRQRLLDGFGWDEQSVANVFDRILTKDDWDFVQGVWDTVEKLWPDVAKLERDVNGVEPEKVEPAEVPTPHGTYRGGYFPIVYDPMQSTHAMQAAEDKIAPSGGWWSITTRSSATKERVNQVKGRPLLLSLSTITHHMNEVIHDITHRQAVSQGKKLLGDDRVVGIINTRMGPEYAKAMRNWLENVAKPNHAYSRENAAIVGLARYLNKAITVAGLGFRVTVSLKQLLGIPFSAKELGSDHLAKGMAVVMAHPVKAYDEMLERSAEMRARSDALDASIEDMHEDMSKGKLKSIGPRGITKYAFQGIVYMDVISRTTVWTSAYNKALGESMGEDDAVSYADRAVRQSHGIGFQKDRAAIQYGHPFARALWPFFSYLNALYNAQRDVGHRVARAETAGDYGEAARRAWWTFAVPALLSAVFFDDGPEDDSVGGWAKYLSEQVVLGNLASLPVVGNLAQALGKGYSYRAISYQSIGDDITKAWKSDKAIVQGDSDLTGSAIKSTLNAAGLIAAKPLGQIGATSGGLYDYSQGTVDPHTVGDWYNLLTRGYIPEQPTAAERIAGRKD